MLRLLRITIAESSN